MVASLPWCPLPTPSFWLLFLLGTGGSRDGQVGLGLNKHRAPLSTCKAGLGTGVGPGRLRSTNGRRARLGRQEAFLVAPGCCAPSTSTSTSGSGGGVGTALSRKTGETGAVSLVPLLVCLSCHQAPAVSSKRDYTLASALGRRLLPSFFGASWALVGPLFLHYFQLSRRSPNSSRRLQHPLVLS